MLILVDIDGVVADLQSEVTRRYNRDYDDDLTNNEITEWELSKFVKPECGTKVYDYFWLPDLYKYVAPIYGAQRGVARLRKMGHRIVYLTSGLNPGKIEWLYDNGFMDGGDAGWQSSPDFVIAHDKDLVRGDLLIDDKPENVVNRLGILFRQPWNRLIEHPFPAWGWGEVTELVKEFD